MSMPVRTGDSDVQVQRPAPGARRGLIVVAYVLIAILQLRGAWAEDGSLELAIKAAYIPKFIPFVKWRSGTFRNPGEAIRICIAGLDPFGGLLDRLVEHQIILGRPLAVQRLPVVTRNSGCQILYASGSPAQSVADVLAVVRGTSVLTITSAAINPGNRGMINFVVVDNRVRFEVDDAAAAAAGITISSKLLRLAVNVLN
jgi:hypothetical protein